MWRLINKDGGCLINGLGEMGGRGIVESQMCAGGKRHGRMRMGSWIESWVEVIDFRVPIFLCVKISVVNAT